MTLKNLENDLIVPKSTLEQAQKAVDDNQLKIDKYAKKGVTVLIKNGYTIKKKAMIKSLIETLPKGLSIRLQTKLER